MNARSPSRRIPTPMLAAMAARNLARHGRRSSLTAICVAATAAAIVVFLGFYRGTYDELFFGAIIDYQTAHAQFQSPSLDPDDPSAWLEEASTMAGWEGAAREAASLPSVIGVAPRLEFPGFAGDGVERLPVLASGVDFEAERRVSVFAKALKAGSLPDKTGEVLVGSGLAKLFGLAPGSALLLQATTAGGNPNLTRCAVSGIFEAGLASLDGSFVALRLADAQGFADAPGRVNRVYVKLEKADDLAGAMPRLEALASSIGAEARPWTYYAKEAIDHAKVESVFYYIFLAILVVVSASAISGTMRMAAIERVKEIAAMRATGWTVAEVRSLFRFESAAIGLAGAAAGSILGGTISALLRAFPIDAGAMGAATDYPFFSMTSSSRPVDFAFAAAVSVLAALAAGAGPARRAAKTNIVRALSGR